MKIVIVEDEPRSARRLARLIKALRPDAHISAILNGVEDAAAWFNANASPELVFLDIELGDGDAFDLLETAEIAAPIIFCTAFSEYALQAFQANSIDYLLKPLTERDLSAALSKYDHLCALDVPPEAWRHLRGSKGGTKGGKIYRRRFLIKGRLRFIVAPVEDVRAVEAWLKMTRLHLTSGEALAFDEPLKQVAQTLDPDHFVQISRQVIVQLDAVSALDRRNGKHIVRLGSGKASFDVSRARVSHLRKKLQNC